MHVGDTAAKLGLSGSFVRQSSKMQYHELMGLLLLSILVISALYAGGRFANMGSSIFNFAEL